MNFHCLPKLPVLEFIGKLLQCPVTRQVDVCVLLPAESRYPESSPCLWPRALEDRLSDVRSEADPAEDSLSDGD